MSEPSRTYNAATTFVDEPLARGWGRRVAFYYEHDRVTYQKLAEATNRTGNALRELGVEMEDRVMLLLYDSPEFLDNVSRFIRREPVTWRRRNDETTRR